MAVLMGLGVAALGRVRRQRIVVPCAFAFGAIVALAATIDVASHVADVVRQPSVFVFLVAVRPSRG